MRVVVIGGTGHIGGYLVPRLVRAGHDVVVVSRGTREPYRPDPAWDTVRRVAVDREAHDAEGTFGDLVADLAPDAVMDLMCFTPESAAQLVHALRGRCGHLLHCGTVWVHGHLTEVPVTEEAPRHPFGDYGIGKAAIERLLLAETAVGGLACTVLHAGHISGPGWWVVNPAGNLDARVWGDLAAGRPVLLPDAGLTTLHHVHADDVASVFVAALNRRSSAAGESFHVVSPAALTMRGFAESAAGWFGREAVLRFAPWHEFADTVGPEHAAASWDHLAHSPSASVAKAAALLGWVPRYTSLQATFEAVRWQVDAGALDIGDARMAAAGL